MQSCPNIAGREIKRRMFFGYFGLFLTVILFIYILKYPASYFMKLMMFIVSMCMSIPLMEVRSETCVVNAFLGLKNMGDKYKRELDMDALRSQRKNSMVIIMKGVLLSLLITGLTFYV